MKRPKPFLRPAAKKSAPIVGEAVLKAWQEAMAKPNPYASLFGPSKTYYMAHPKPWEFGTVIRDRRNGATMLVLATEHPKDANYGRALILHPGRLTTATGNYYNFSNEQRENYEVIETPDTP